MSTTINCSVDIIEIHITKKSDEKEFRGEGRVRALYTCSCGQPNREILQLGQEKKESYCLKCGAKYLIEVPPFFDIQMPEISISKLEKKVEASSSTSRNN